MSTRDGSLIIELINALCLIWSDNGNISADAVRDQCITALASATGKSFEEIEAMVEQRIIEMQ